MKISLEKHRLRVTVREAVLTVNPLCFGAKQKKKRKICIPVYTPVLLYIKWGFKGYTLHGHHSVFLMIPFPP